MKDMVMSNPPIKFVNQKTMIKNISNILSIKNKTNDREDYHNKHNKNKGNPERRKNPIPTPINIFCEFQCDKNDSKNAQESNTPRTV